MKPNRLKKFALYRQTKNEQKGITMNKIIILLACVVLAGCSSIPMNAPPKVWADKSAVSKDQFTGHVTVVSPNISLRVDKPFGFFRYQLLAINSKTTGPSYYFQFSSMRGLSAGWAYWEQIFDTNKTAMPVVLVKQRINGGTLQESGTVILNRQQVETLKSNSPWRICGANAQFDFMVNPGLASGFLDRCDQSF